MAAAPYILPVLTALLLILSLRLRTATFMFGAAALLAGAATFVLGLVSEVIARLFGVSNDVWSLLLQHASSSSPHLRFDHALFAGGCALLALRLVGPSLRRRFWRRLLASADDGAAQFAAERLRTPAGLLEPWYCVRAVSARARR